MNENVSREQHLQWCKRRALEYLDVGEVEGAFCSMMSDMQKHPDTQRHPDLMLGILSRTLGNLSGVDQMRKYINGFN